MPPMRRPPVNRLPLLVVAGLLAIGIAVPISEGELGFGATSSSSPSAGTSPSGSALGAVSPTPPQGSASPSPAASSTPAPSSPAPAATIVKTAIVPVTQFRSPVTATNRAELATVLAGTSTRYEALTLVDDEADAILGALGVARPSDTTRLVLAKDAATLSRDLAKHRKRLGFIRAEDVTPAVRALAWGDRSLFGVDRVKKAADWRLNAELPRRADEHAFDPASTWTLFAGGDILLDRGVYETLRVKGRGPDFPFAGGTAEITSRCRNCSPLGWDLPRTRRTGNAGSVREVISGADIAMANFENPAPNRFTWHTSKTVFTADPTLIDGLVKAGIDYVSIANNHIGDAGNNGILQTIANLKKRGLRYSGAGKDLAAAQKPAILMIERLLGRGQVLPRAREPETALLRIRDRLQDPVVSGVADVVVGDRDIVDARLDEPIDQRRVGGEDRLRRMPGEPVRGGVLEVRHRDVGARDDLPHGAGVPVRRVRGRSQPSGEQVRSAR